MQLDLKNVRVTYSVREVVAVIGLLCSFMGYIVRTEMHNTSLQAQVTTLSTDVAACKIKLAELQQRAAR